MGNVKHSDFALTSCQAVIFTPEEEISVSRILKDIWPRWQSRLNSDPISLPRMDALPPQAPRVLLHSRADDWLCQFAQARVDFIWQKKNRDSPVPTLEGFFVEASTKLCEYADSERVRVGRIGAIATQCAPHPRPGKFLTQHFCNERALAGPLKRAESFELHARKAYKLADKFEINSWVRSRTGILPAENNLSVVLVEQDLNTTMDDANAKAFSINDVSSFFSAAASEMDSILALYYPND